MSDACMGCRWWNRHGNARALKDDTGTCMLRHHFRKQVPGSHRTEDRKAVEVCDFFGRGDKPVRDYPREFAALTAAQTLLDKVAASRSLNSPP